MPKYYQIGSGSVTLSITRDNSSFSGIDITLDAIPPTSVEFASFDFNDISSFDISYTDISGTVGSASGNPDSDPFSITVPESQSIDSIEATDSSGNTEVLAEDLLFVSAEDALSEEDFQKVYKEYLGLIQESKGIFRSLKEFLTTEYEPEVASIADQTKDTYLQIPTALNAIASGYTYVNTETFETDLKNFKTDYRNVLNHLENVVVAFNISKQDDLFSTIGETEENLSPRARDAVKTKKLNDFKEYMNERLEGKQYTMETDDFESLKEETVTTYLDENSISSRYAFVPEELKAEAINLLSISDGTTQEIVNRYSDGYSEDTTQDSFNGAVET